MRVGVRRQGEIAGEVVLQIFVVLIIHGVSRVDFPESGMALAASEKVSGEIARRPLSMRVLCSFRRA
jgi:hypothetical protein